MLCIEEVPEKGAFVYSFNFDSDSNRLPKFLTTETNRKQRF